MAGPLLRLRNPLAFPGGAPGFNANHPASAGISNGHGVSAVPTSAGNYVNLLTGAKGTVSGPSAAVTSIGASANFGATGGNANYIQLPGQTTTLDTSGTIAAICFPVAWATNAANAIFCTSYVPSNNTGITLQYNTATAFPPTGLCLPLGGGANNLIGVVLPPGYPYFIAGSYSPTKGTNIVAVNLATGQIYTGTGAAAGTPLAPNGTYEIGNGFGANRNFQGWMGPVMYSPTFMSMAALLQWAGDPWSFWYPGATESLLRMAVRKATTAYAQTVAISTTSAVSAVKAVSATRTISSTSAVSAVKAAAKKLSMTTTSAVSAIKAAAKKLSMTTTSAVSLKRSVGKVASIATTSAVACQKSAGKLLTLSTSGAVTAVKAVSKRVSLTTISAVSVIAGLPAAARGGVRTLTLFGIKAVMVLLGQRSSLSLIGIKSALELTGMSGLETNGEFRAGETWTISGTAQTIAGVPMNLTGANVQLRLTNDDTSVALDLSTNASTGTIVAATAGTYVFNVSPSQQTSASLTATSYDYEVRVTLADGTVSTQNTGRIRVKPSKFTNFPPS